jgi:hypothetical protein
LEKKILSESIKFCRSKDLKVMISRYILTFCTCPCLKFQILCHLNTLYTFKQVLFKDGVFQWKRLEKLIILAKEQVAIMSRNPALQEASRWATSLSVNIFFILLLILRCLFVGSFSFIHLCTATVSPVAFMVAEWVCILHVSQFSFIKITLNCNTQLFLSSHRRFLLY